LWFSIISTESGSNKESIWKLRQKFLRNFLLMLEFLVFRVFCSTFKNKHSLPIIIIEFQQNKSNNTMQKHIWQHFITSTHWNLQIKTTDWQDNSNPRVEYTHRHSKCNIHIGRRSVRMNPDIWADFFRIVQLHFRLQIGCFRISGSTGSCSRIVLEFFVD
jgi:hypothetical protein